MRVKATLYELSETIFNAVKFADVNNRGDTDGSGEKVRSHYGSLKAREMTRRKKTPFGCKTRTA